MHTSSASERCEERSIFIATLGECSDDARRNIAGDGTDTDVGRSVALPNMPRLRGARATPNADGYAPLARTTSSELPEPHVQPEPEGGDVQRPEVDSPEPRPELQWLAQLCMGDLALSATLEADGQSIRALPPLVGAGNDVSARPYCVRIQREGAGSPCARAEMDAKLIETGDEEAYEIELATNPEALKHKVVLVERIGEWADALQASRAIGAGATALVIYGDEAVAPCGIGPGVIPVLGVSRRDVDVLAKASRLKLSVEPLCIAAAMGDVAPETLLMEGQIGMKKSNADRMTSTPLQLLCTNSRLTPELLQSALGPLDCSQLAKPQAEVLQATLADLLRSEAIGRDVPLAVALLQGWVSGMNALQCSRVAATWAEELTQKLADLLKSKRIDLAVTLARGCASGMIAAAPTTVENLRQMYRGGLESLATELLREHGVLHLNYRLGCSDGTTCDEQEGTFDISRVDLGSMGVVTAGSEKIDMGCRLDGGSHWIPHLKSTQIREVSEKTSEKADAADQNAQLVDVKPAVLAVRFAARAGDEGLLSVLVDESVPINAFGTRIAEVLIKHKWNAFGRDLFTNDIYWFVARIVSWQILAWLIAQYGDDTTGVLGWVTEHRAGSTDLNFNSSVKVGIVAVASMVVHMVLSMRRLRLEWCEATSWKDQENRSVIETLYRHLIRSESGASTTWNRLDATTIVVSTVVILRTLARNAPAFTTQLAVVNTVLLWLRAIQMLTGFESA